VRAGITFIGVGIETDYVTKFYPKENTVVVYDLDELYPGVIEKLNRLMKRG
jgi:cobalamin biosynthesis protein CobT